MIQLIVEKVTGFKNKTPHIPIIIRDFRGQIFYSTVGLKEVTSFNMPVGCYYIDSGNFEPMSKPKTYKIPKLPPYEKNKRLPLNFIIIFGTNLNKCTIKWDKKEILFDNALRNKTLPELFFILYHEYGHSKYHTEKYADLFSVCMMLKKGYNPSQIGEAPITSLSNYQMYRKRHVVNKLIK